jgi:hypothetical protein
LAFWIFDFGLPVSRRIRGARSARKLGATLNSLLEVTAGPSQHEKPTVRKALTVATLPEVLEAMMPYL